MDSIHIRVATEADLAFLATQDHLVTADVQRRKVAAGEVYIAEVDGEPVGCLRYGWFWDTIPLMNLLHVAESWRGRGVGTRLTLHWEADMKALGAEMVMTTTQANERGQFLYRKLGYHGIVIPDETVLELILIKRL
jgi:ribosomal protein S18 acetylase RimI-like enzyme